MKKITFFFTGAILLVALFAVPAFKSLLPGQSANGQGTLNEVYHNGIPQHFAFHANKDANGNVSGTWESKSAGQDIRAHGTINCLTILSDGKTAVLTGVVTHVVGNGFPLNIGDPIWFKVQDNGEGSNSTNDRFTDYYVFGDCINWNAYFPQITGGNIQVKP
jgi:hypothetical protein